MGKNRSHAAQEARVRTLLKEGLGRRIIAQDLGVTEWAVRQHIKQISSSDQLLRDDEHTTTTLQIVRSDESMPTKAHAKIKKVKPNVRSSSGTNPRIHKAIHRDVQKKVAVLSDIHYPYEDEKVCEIADMFLVDYKPDIVVYNGDVVDCYAVSSFEKSPSHKMDIQEELDYGNRKVAERMDRLPSVQQWYWLEGNHESRFRRLIRRDAKALETLRDLSFEKSAGIEDLGITWVPGHEELMIGSLLFTHGTTARRHAGSSARAHYEMYGCSVIVGHCHRLSVGYKRNKFGDHALIENGTLSDLDVEYAKFPDWQHGFTTIDYDGNDFGVTSHAIKDYKLIANGVVYAL